MKHRLLSTLGICRSAGKMVWGFDVVADAARDNSVCLILTAEDLSPKTRKEIMLIADRCKTELCTAPITMDEIWYRLGKRVGILAITDPGLAQTVKSAVIRANEEE